MDVNQTIVDALKTISERQTENHLDVVQRMTRVETQLAAIPPLAPLELRVQKLEGWRNYLAGGFVVLGFGIKSALAYVSRK